MNESSSPPIELNYLLEEVHSCLASLSFKEAEIQWDLNEISRPQNEKSKKSKQNAEMKLKNLIQHINSFQNELKIILEGLNEVKSTSDANKVHWMKLIDEGKIVKIKVCAAIVKNSDCFNYKSKKCSVPIYLPHLNSKIKLHTLKSPLNFDANNMSIKDWFKISSQEEDHLSSIIRIQSGGDPIVIESTKDKKYQTGIKLSSDQASKFALDLEERVVSITDPKRPSSKINPEKLSKEISQEMNRFQEICSILDEVQAPDLEESEPPSESTSISEMSSAMLPKDEEITSQIGLKQHVSLALGETLDNLTKTFEKLENFEINLHNGST